MNSAAYSAELALQGQLQRGKEIRWAGQPEPNFFTVADIFLIPFSLLWGGFAIFWEASAIVLPSTSGGDTPLAIRVLFPLFGIPFVLVGLYLIFGRLLFRKWRRKHTYYAVTNRRLLELTRAPGVRLNSAPIDSVSNIAVSQRSSGIGTVAFGTPASSRQNSPWGFPFGLGSSMWKNTGLDVFGVQQGMAFFDIKDAARVQQIVEELRYGLKSA